MAKDEESSATDLSPSAANWPGAPSLPEPESGEPEDIFEIVLD